MRRLLRCSFYAASVLSLLLCATTVVLWVRSYWYIADVGRQGEDTCVTCGANQGRAELFGVWAKGYFAPTGNWFVRCDQRPIPFAEMDLFDGANHHWGGFGLYHGRYDGVGHGFAVAVPMWGMVLAFLVLPGLWTRRYVRLRQSRERQSHGLCLKCGYDLRAHAPGQRCPECGTPVPAGQERMAAALPDPSAAGQGSITP